LELIDFIFFQPSASDKAFANQRLAPSNKLTLPNVVTTPTGKILNICQGLIYKVWEHLQL